MKTKMSKKQVAFILVAICLVGLIGIGISYSYYLANISTSNESNKNSDISSATITKVVMDMQGKVTSDGAYPGHKVVKEVIVRGIGEDNSLPANASIQIIPDLGAFVGDVTWKLYQSDTAITCSSTVHEDGEQYYEEATCNIPANATLELEGGSESAYKNIVVNPNTETKYYLVVEYANKENQNDQIGKSFNIDIGIDEKKTSPLDNVIAQLDTTGKCPTINDDGTVNVTEVEATDGYVCSAPDAYGTSYYYRGNVTNNYVKFGKWSDDVPDVVYGYYDSDHYSFKEYSSLEECQSASSYNTDCTLASSNAGKDMYWRIVRVNGDGSVRMIYDGASAHANGEGSLDRQIGVSNFNRNTDDNMSAGYMYGEITGVVEDVSQYDTETWENSYSYYVAKEYTFDENTKKFALKDPVRVLTTDLTDDYIGYYTNGWISLNESYSMLYKITSITSGSENATIGFSRIYVGSTSKENAQANINSSTIKTYLDTWYEKNLKGTNYEKYMTDNIFCNDRSIRSGLGYGKVLTSYRWSSLVTSNSTLKCPQQNDAFSVNDVIHGNGNLSYPVGLITADEVVLAGGSSWNKNYYLYSGDWYWTMSPAYLSWKYGMIIRYVEEDGSADGNFNDAYQNGDVRPILNISSEILLNGQGTAEDPYRLTDD